MPPKPTAASQTSITITVNGRTYTCAVGSSIQVPDFDALALSANGWGIIPYIPVGDLPVGAGHVANPVRRHAGDNDLVERCGLGSSIERQRRLAHEVPLRHSAAERRQ